MSRVLWEELSRARCGPVDRDAWFFPSSGERIYASRAQPTGTPATEGFVVLPCWGMEGRVSLEWCHRMARGLAERGAVGLVPHWPGFQDSEGDAGALDLARLVEVCRDATVSASDRAEVRRWSVVGIGVSAAVACVVARALDLHRLVLVQPELDPPTHFDLVERRGQRAFLAGTLPPGWAFGNPIPAGLRGPEVRDAVRDAVTSCAGDRVVVHYRRPRSAVPAGFRGVSVWGNGRDLFGYGSDHPLLVATLRWYARARRSRS